MPAAVDMAEGVAAGAGSPATRVPWTVGGAPVPRAQCFAVYKVLCLCVDLAQDLEALDAMAIANRAAARLLHQDAPDLWSALKRHSDARRRLFADRARRQVARQS